MFAPSPPAGGGGEEAGYHGACYRQLVTVIAMLVSPQCLLEGSLLTAFVLRRSFGSDIWLSSDSNDFTMLNPDSSPCLCAL